MKNINSGLMDLIRRKRISLPSSPDVALKNILNFIKKNPEKKLNLLKVIDSIAKALRNTKGEKEKTQNILDSLLPRTVCSWDQSESFLMKKLLSPQREEAERIIADILYGIASESDWDKKVREEIETLTESMPVKASISNTIRTLAGRILF